MKAKKILALTLVGALSVGTFAACGASSADGGSSDGAQIIHIGTGNAYIPYCYLDEDGNLAGYEYEVLQEVDALLDQYEFEYESTDFDTLLTSLDAGKYDLVAHQFEVNDERQEKYLYADEPYTTFITYISVASDRDDITSLDDLAGKTLYMPTGDASQPYIEEYIAEHQDNPINLVTSEYLQDDLIVAAINDGTYDAVIKTKRDVEKINDAYGTTLKVVGDPINDSKTYYLYRKDETELQEAVDGALKELKESGKLSEISIDVLGGDFTEGE